MRWNAARTSTRRVKLVCTKAEIFQFTVYHDRETEVSYFFLDSRNLWQNLCTIVCHTVIFLTTPLLSSLNKCDYGYVVLKYDGISIKLLNHMCTTEDLLCIPLTIK